MFKHQRPTLLVPTMLIPFSRTADRPFVLHHATRMSKLPRDTAEKHLNNQLHVQRRTMMKRGIATPLLERELVALERAIRSEMSRLNQLGGSHGQEG